MMDPRLKEVLEKYQEAERESVWLHERGRNKIWIVKHAACERMAARAGIEFADPALLYVGGNGDDIALLVKGLLGGQTEWSIGESSPANCKNAYPWAMAEKRGKDRVILKLLQLHGLAYSDVEADDFVQPEKKSPERMVPRDYPATI